MLQLPEPFPRANSLGLWKVLETVSDGFFEYFNLSPNDSSPQGTLLKKTCLRRGSQPKIRRWKPYHAVVSGGKLCLYILKGTCSKVLGPSGRAPEGFEFI